MPSLFLLALIGVPALIIGFIVIAFINTWLKAKLNGAPVGFANLLGMRLGGVPYNLVVDARITAVKAGIELSTDTIAAHFLAGGNVVPTIQALIDAGRAAGATIVVNATPEPGAGKTLALQAADGKPLRSIDPAVCRATAAQIAGERQQSDLFFASIKRLLDRDQSGWRALD